MFENSQTKIPTFKNLIEDSNSKVFSNAVTAFLFSLTGPMAILLSAAQTGGLAEREIISWFFAGYFIGGLFTIILSLIYLQPISFAWSLPAAAIVGVSLQHLSFSQVIGAYLATGVLIMLISVTGVAKKGMDFIPLPIAMGMVAGIFLPFVLRLVSIFAIDPLLSAITIGTFFLLSSGKFSLFMPPVLFSTIIGIALIAFRGGFNILPFEFSFVQPILYTPEFSLRAMLELVLPLSITVVGIHNIQSIAILRREEYDPPVNVLTFICGIGSIFSGLMGSVTTCMTGPATAILNTSGTHRSRYVGSIVLGFFFMTSALIAPVVIRLALMIPTTLISLLCGLALFRILLDSLHVAFNGKFLFGAMASFLITVSNVSILNIGAAFWGLVVGCIISLVMEPQDFRKHNKIFKRSSSDR